MPACWCSIASTWRCTSSVCDAPSDCCFVRWRRSSTSKRANLPTSIFSPGARSVCAAPHASQPHEDWIRAVNFEIQVPRVIRLLRFDRLPKQELHLSRRNILARDEHCCQYCGRHFPTHQLSIDHVMPRSRGGGHQLGKSRVRLPGVQHQERRPHSARGQDAARPTSFQTQAKSAPGLEARKPQVRELEKLARWGSLGHRHPRLRASNRLTSP